MKYNLESPETKTTITKEIQIYLYSTVLLLHISKCLNYRSLAVTFVVYRKRFLRVTLMFAIGRFLCQGAGPYCRVRLIDVEEGKEHKIRLQDGGQ